MSVTAVSINDYLKQLHKNHRKHNRFTTFLMMLSLVVVLGVAWELRGIGISMTNETDCGIEEHQHSPGCYEIIQICGLDEGDETEDGMFHSHNDDCMEYRLLCDLEEHVHTVECIHLEPTEPDAEEQTADDELKQPADEEQELLLTDETPEEETDETPEEETDETTEDEETLFYRELLEELRAGILELFAEVPEELDYVFADDFVLDEETYYEIIMSDALSDKAPNYDDAALWDEGDDTFNTSVLFIQTALGIRSMNRVHEHLEGITWGDRADGYLFNTDHNPYVLQVGETVELVGFSTNEPTDYTKGPYFWWRDSPGDGVEGILEKDFHNNYAGQVIIDGVPCRKVTARITAREPGKTYIEFENRRFYIEVCSLYSKDGEGNIKVNPDGTYVRDKYDHADIEIADGGNYTITETVEFEDGTKEITETTYLSYVSDVNKCYIYDGDVPAEGQPDTRKVIRVFETTDYEAHGEVGGTQFELTSKYKCVGKEDKEFLKTDVKSARFDVELLLKPWRQTVTREYPNGTKETIEDNRDISDPSGNSDIVLPSAVFDLGTRSVIDAENKCPNHSGLDFNILSKLDSIIKVKPKSFELKAGKDILGGNISEHAFEFELLDDKGSVLKKAKNDASGNISFGKLYFVAPGTFHYTIREVIPNGAKRIGENAYVYDNVVYDGREIEMDVTISYTNGEQEVSIDNIATNYDLNFFNEQVPNSKYKDLQVRKVWSDGAETHSSESIKFRIYCTKGDQPEYLFSINGNSVFTLNSANSWSMIFDKLPSEIDGEVCNYRVEELPMLGYVAEYIASEDDSAYNVTISNKKKADAQLYVEKQWLDVNGLPVPPPQTELPITISRKYKKVPVPVQIVLQVGTADNHTDYYFDEYAYEGSGLTFQLTSNGDLIGSPQVVAEATEHCNCEKQGANRFVVTNVEEGAKVVVREGEWIWHWTTSQFEEGTGFYQWSLSGSGNWYRCRWKYHTNLSDEVNSVRVQSRKNAYDGIQMRINPAHFGPNGYYNISAYVMSENKYDDQAVTPDVPGLNAKMTLKYTSTGGQPRYAEVATYQFSNDDLANGRWCQLQNKNFHMPEDIDTGSPVYILFESIDSGTSGQTRADFYVDDLTIGASNRTMQVDGNGQRYHYGLQTPEKPVPADALNWTEDTNGWPKSFTLYQDSDWKMHLSAPDLGESNVRDYRYFVQEPTVPYKYSVHIIRNGVSTNTESTPIVIQNRLAAYELPHTGGRGATNIRFLGLITLLCTGTAGVYIKKRRRRSSA